MINNSSVSYFRLDDRVASLSSHRREEPPVAGQPDQLVELLRATASGDRQAFFRLYEMTSGKLLGIAIRMLRRRDLAEEVLQEAYLAIWQKAGQFSPEHGSPLGWLTTIVRHRAIDRLRSMGASREVAIGSDQDLDIVGGAVDGALETEAVVGQTIRRCLERLKEKQRELILLAFYHGFTHDELSARLAIPLGTVKSDVRRGLADLKVCLER